MLGVTTKLLGHGAPGMNARGLGQRSELTRFGVIRSRVSLNGLVEKYHLAIVLTP
jgi:hypothetical protein